MVKALLSLLLTFVMIGCMVRYAPWMYRWFGHLPGDFWMRGDNMEILVPCTSLILTVLLFSVVLRLIR